MEKNTAGKWVVFAYGLPDHASAGQPITGDAANITANIRIDGGAANAVDDVNPTELEDGYYIFDITAVEANGDLLSLHPVSATANVQVIGVPGSVWTRPANFNALGIESDGDISGVVLVDTTTTNTDMRGTDSAALAANWTAARAGYVDNINGHTAQTGDNYARLGAPAGASVSADIADVPTVAEFNARTLAAAAYFDPAADTVATVTTLTNLPAITSNWLTAAGIAASALDGKGDWNVGKTGYSLSQAFPTNFADLSITATTGRLDVASIEGVDATNQINSACDTAISDAALATAANLSTVDANVDSVLVDTQDIQTRLPAALVSGRMDSNASAIAGDATAATNLSSSALGIVSGACEGTPTTTVIQTDLSEATDDHYIGRVVVFTSGSAAGQATDITDYTGATGTLTVTALTTAPSATDNFVIV